MSNATQLKCAGKPQGWLTAFYCFAEGISELTDGTVNHKALYAMLGTRGDYVNHENAAIRVSSAPALSKLIHSSRYAADFKKRFQEDPEVFSQAAKLSYEMIKKAVNIDDDELCAYLCGPLWTQFEIGLNNERLAGRSEVKVNRVGKEIKNLFSHAAISFNDNPRASIEHVLEGYFTVATFGHLDIDHAHNLVGETPLERPDATRGLTDSFESACLIKVYPDGAVGGFCFLSSKKPSIIGRYTDCDVIESNTSVSRRHCRISYGEDNKWHLEDFGSKFGTEVIRDGICIYNSLETNADEIILKYDDKICLGGGVTYTLSALRLPRVLKNSSVYDHIQTGGSL